MPGAGEMAFNDPGDEYRQGAGFGHKTLLPCSRAIASTTNASNPTAPRER